MQCVHPVYVKLVDLWVPCGKCMPCRIRRASEWAVRLTQEYAENPGGGLFATFTYDNEHLPEKGSLEKREYQLLIKRIRKEVSPLKIKYYGCGEYGEERGRPHYHAIIFGLRCSEESKELLTKCWGKGLVNLGTVTYNSCRYVAEYISKGMMVGSSVYQLQLDGKEPPFALMSQGIGKSYVEKNKKQIIENIGVKLQGKEVGLPRYYRKILGLDKEQLAEKAIINQEKELKRLMKQCKGDESKVYERHVSELKQRLNKLKKKKELKRARDVDKSAY